MEAHEREFEQRVKEAVVREMAAMGVAPVGLPPAEGATEETGKKEPAMTNEKLREMAAQDALEWIMGHPQEPRGWRSSRGNSILAAIDRFLLTEPKHK